MLLKATWSESNEKETIMLQLVLDRPVSIDFEKDRKRYKKEKDGKKKRIVMEK